MGGTSLVAEVSAALTFIRFRIRQEEEQDSFFGPSFITASPHVDMILALLGGLLSFANGILRNILN